MPLRGKLPPKAVVEQGDVLFVQSMEVETPLWLVGWFKGKTKYSFIRHPKKVPIVKGGSGFVDKTLSVEVTPFLLLVSVPSTYGLRLSSFQDSGQGHIEVGGIVVVHVG